MFDARGSEPHLDPRQGPDQHQIIDPAEMADPEHLACDFAQTGAQRDIEAVENDRAHRIGQERPVTVYRLITKDSIEDSIVRLHEKKREVASSLLDDGDAVAGLSADELGLLVSESLSLPA